MPKIKNILIFVTIGVIFVLIYIFFIKSSSNNTPALVSSNTTPVNQNAVAVTTTDSAQVNADMAATQDLLNLLLSVKDIKLDSSIFSDNAFINLHDSSITLTPDNNEGRINPFAAIGNDAHAPATIVNPPAH